MRSYIQRIIPFTLAFVVLTACGCSDGTDCADCGGCGFAGPVSEDILVVSQSGTDEKGIPTVRLSTWKGGTCKSDPAPTTFVHYASGVVSAEVVANGTAIATDTVTVDAQGVVSWNGTMLSMSYSKPDLLSVTLTFTDAGQVKVFVCHANMGEAASCVLMP